jgi:glycosyltransferase involved in cell wall biosynthesis
MSMTGNGLQGAVHVAETVVRSRAVTIVPCIDEEDAIGPLVAAILAHGVGQVIVVDGGSRDRTRERAEAAGAAVVVEPRRGYGRALLSGLACLPAHADIVLFLDGDGSDRPEKIPDVLAPIEQGRADFVLGSRIRGERELGSLSPAQIAAGHLAGLLIWMTYGSRFTDMSPFKAIRREALDGLGMRETTYGWNLEMQMRAAAAGLRIAEVAVGQRRRRGGISKVSGNWRAIVPVAWSLASTFVRLAAELRTECREHQRPSRSSH